MDLYRQKYLKYKKKYLTLKNQFGGDFTIEFDEIINRHSILSNIKDAFYSYCYLFRTSIEKENEKICSKDFAKINCSLIDKIEFEIIGCHKKDICNIKILKDNKFNNLVICFEHGSLLMCPIISIDLLTKLSMLYEKIYHVCTQSDYNKIILVGHSMGASIIIIFMYIIMIIEKSTTSIMYNYESKYFCYSNDDLSVPEYVYYTEDFEEEKKDENEHNIKWNTKIKVQKEKIKKCETDKYESSILNSIIKKGLPYIHNKMEICIGGGFPVLFRNTDLHNFKEMIDFYNNKFIHLINTKKDDTGKIISYDPYVLNMDRNFGFHSKIELSNFITYDIDYLIEINLNELPVFFRHHLEPDNLDSLNIVPLDYHMYVKYIETLKKFINIRVL